VVTHDNPVIWWCVTGSRKLITWPVPVYMSGSNWTVPYINRYFFHLSFEHWRDLGDIYSPKMLPSCSMIFMQNESLSTYHFTVHKELFVILQNITHWAHIFIFLKKLPFSTLTIIGENNNIFLQQYFMLNFCIGVIYENYIWYWRSQIWRKGEDTTLVLHCALFITERAFDAFNFTSYAFTYFCLCVHVISESTKYM